ncbi:L-type lectin-domain containing receptor kinase IX.1-like [Cryptomeria japonica]|uniref:L-type lectin-domain containing receptor kinase IX.1-like n=1 Tax=Cryptomeria japonica TaxID=3369 RepID=UPI0027D9FC61|nr:L-type lectin-domain containing receptor kinase IX.1-like [Cryptomeria japonica]
MSNGRLNKHLFIKGDIPPLQWSHTYRIALEIASGLLYLHIEWAHCIVHRDVKSSNVMLANNLNAKLGDFDVYSFGAVALEIATGRRAVDWGLQQYEACGVGMGVEAQRSHDHLTFPDSSIHV